MRSRRQDDRRGVVVVGVGRVAQRRRVIKRRRAERAARAEVSLSERLTLELEALLGSDEKLDKDTGLVGRSVIWVASSDGSASLSLEPDPRRADIALAKIGLEADCEPKTARCVSNPAVKRTEGDDEAELVDLTLEDSGAESNRPIEFVDRYIALGRDIRWAGCRSYSE